MILHLPLRGYGLYERKIRQGGRSYAANADLPAQMGATWRKEHLTYLSGDLRQRWSENFLSTAQLWRGRVSGRYRRPPIRSKRPPAPRGDLSRR